MFGVMIALVSRYEYTLWRRQMETFSTLLALCAGNPPVTSGFPLQRPVTRSFDVFFDLRLNKRLNKQSRRGWFETPSRPLWRHRNVGRCDLPFVLARLEVLLQPLQNLGKQVSWSPRRQILLDLALKETETTKHTDLERHGGIVHQIYVHGYVFCFDCMYHNFGWIDTIQLSIL